MTAFSEYVFEGYDVQALNYLLKPITYDKLCKVLGYVSEKLGEDRYTLRDKGDIIQIPYSQIIYFSSSNHYTHIITTRGNHRQLEHIKNIQARLPARFIFCHRTVIVNLEHVTMLKGRELMLSNKTAVPVSQTYLQEVRSRLLSYADSMR
ncbi:Transcriptional regulatory protein BtsR [bioreactor metagenome]|uniref:Transcriptional regulatory protein BtsR n=1 Tax=bioreactor metagenome TaxID=1076179 RepID=A0A644YAM9_9ZZZZ